MDSLGADFGWQGKMPVHASIGSGVDHMEVEGGFGIAIHRYRRDKNKLEGDTKNSLLGSLLKHV